MSRVSDKDAALMLGDILADRLFHDERESFPSISQDVFAELPLRIRERVFGNISLLLLCNGHGGSMLRRIIESGQSSEARFLHSLLEWSRFIAHNDISFAGDILTTVPALMVGEVRDPYALYERIQFIEHHYPERVVVYEDELLLACAGALGRGLGDGLKWYQMVADVFRVRDPSVPLRALFKHIGFIPSELYTKKKFTHELEPQLAVKVLAALAGFGPTDCYYHYAQYERAKLLNYFFTSGMAQRARGDDTSLVLDSNGLRLDMTRIGLHVHIPYGLIRDACMDVFAFQEWLDDVGLTEVQLRRFEANTRLSQQVHIASEQAEDFARAFHIERAGVHTTSQLLVIVSHQFDQFVDRVLKQKLIIPDVLINALLREGHVGMYHALQLAEALAVAVSGSTFHYDTETFFSYALLREHHSAYRAQERILHQPEYYTIAKIVRSFLLAPIYSDPKQHFLVLRGCYAKSEHTGHQHSFIEVVYDGKIARVLIDEEKHLDDTHRRAFHHVSLYERPAYDRFEAAFRSLHYYTHLLSETRALARSHPGGWRVLVRDRICALSHFVQSNVTKHAQTVSDLYASLPLEFGRHDIVLIQLFETFSLARREYLTFMYSHAASAADFEEHISPEVEKRDVVFDSAYADEATTHCAADGFDTALCTSGVTSRVVMLRYTTKDPTESIPYHIGLDTLTAARIDPARPLINVIGGCRRVDTNSENYVNRPFAHMAASVLSVAHRHHANVGVPGTQSGIGVDFGKAYVEYIRTSEHLAHAEKLHMFSIVPGANVYLPHSDLCADTPQHEVFALVPATAIVTPHSADWHLAGFTKRDSSYWNHIQNMEDFYRRMSAGQKRVMVVGNGGLYSVAEVNASLRNDFDLMLISGSGRFAEAAAALFSASRELDVTGSDERMMHDVLNILRHQLDSDVVKEFFMKDIGGDVSTTDEGYLLYREYFFAYLRLAEQYRVRIMTTSLNDLERDLNTYFLDNKNTTEQGIVSTV